MDEIHGVAAVTRAVEEFEARCAAATPFGDRPYPYSDADAAEFDSLKKETRRILELCSVRHGVPTSDGTTKRLIDRVHAAMNRLEP
jgi:hypothetical protein